MHAKKMMLLTGLILAVGVGSGVLADPPDQNVAPMAGRVPIFPRLSLKPIPSDTGHYLGHYVGGGTGRPNKAEQRADDEGTWGWDYQGWLIPRRVNLGWSHGKLFQGGTGSYKTEGPRLYREEEGKK